MSHSRGGRPGGRGLRAVAATSAMIVLAVGATAGPPAPPAPEDPGFGPARSPAPRRRTVPAPGASAGALEGFAADLVLRPLRGSGTPPPVSSGVPALTPADLVPGKSDERAARARTRAGRARGPERELFLRLARHHETGDDAPEIERLADGVLVVRFPGTAGGADGPESFAVDPAAPPGLRVYRLGGPPPERTGSTAPASED